MLPGVGAAPDGSPVEVYTRLPESGEGEVVAEVVPAGASILELGCGSGRITRQLVRLGFRVTAVDESAEMLAHVRAAETVHAPIEGPDLGLRFDAVLLASNLVNSETERRRAFLETCRRHADLVVVEGLPLGWSPEDGESSSTRSKAGRGGTRSRCGSSPTRRSSARRWPRRGSAWSAGSTGAGSWPDPMRAARAQRAPGSSPRRAARDLPHR